MKRIVYPTILIVLISLFAVTSCSMFDVYSGEGTIIHLDFEVGYYGLVGDDGENFEVTNLEADYPELMVDSLRVRYRVRELKDMDSFIMWGIIVEALSLKELEE